METEEAKKVQPQGDDAPANANAEQMHMDNPIALGANTEEVPVVDDVPA